MQTEGERRQYFNQGFTLSALLPVFPPMSGEPLQISSLGRFAAAVETAAGVLRARDTGRGRDHMLSYLATTALTNQ